MAPLPAGLIAACRQWLVPPPPVPSPLVPPPAGAPEGVEGNGRLTAVNGMLLIGLLAVEGATLLDVRGLITLHVYLGLLLIGPVLLKCASTGYRFLRYYGRRRPYLEKGPPPLVLRVLGPVVVLSSLAVLGTGVGLIFTRPGHHNLLLTLHQASFVVWFAVMVVHVLGHVLEAAVLSWREVRDPRSAAGVRRRRWRAIAVAASLVAGVALASALMPSAHGWTSHRSDQHERRDR